MIYNAHNFLNICKPIPVGHKIYQEHHGQAPSCSFTHQVWHSVLSQTHCLIFVAEVSFVITLVFVCLMEMTKFRSSNFLFVGRSAN